MHDSSISSSKLPPILPTELVDDILSRQLSKSDLARCCLVSRQFLGPARQYLYSQVQFECCLNGITGNNFEEIAPERSTFLLLQTLQTSSSLSSIVKTVIARSSSNRSKGSYRGRKVSDILRDFLGLLRHVDQLYLQHNAFEHQSEFVYSHSQTLTRLEAWSLEASRIFGPINHFPNLKWLVIYNLRGSDTQQIYLLPQLASLRIHNTTSRNLIIAPNTSSSLKSLEGSSFCLWRYENLSGLPVLQHVGISSSYWFVPPHVYPRIGELLQNCRRLLSLSINAGSAKEIFNVSDLLERLPASLIRLDFTSYIPRPSLLQVVESGSLKSLRVIGLSKDLESWSTEKMNDFKVACNNQMIELEFLTD